MFVMSKQSPFTLMEFRLAFMIVIGQYMPMLSLVWLSGNGSHGMPVLAYDRGSRGSIAYMALASEFMRREKKANG